MSTTAGHATHETRIEADPKLPTIEVTRDFDAPPGRVFRAMTDPALVVQWLGPDDTETRIDRWEARTGGSYRYSMWRDGQEIASFYGSFHEVRPDQRLVQTFTWEGAPDGVSLDTSVFEDLGDGRTRMRQTSVVENLEVRDAIIASGMETGVLEGFAKLDALLAHGDG
jgi:uncharacterized protein YndB with AHSA1/START domain